MTGRKRNVFLIFSILTLVVFLSAATYAYLLFSANVTNSEYNSMTACFDIDYDITNDDGSAPITGTLFQTATPKGGLSGKVAINIKPDCDAQGYAKVSLNVKSGSDVLFQTVGAHCENSKTLVTLDKYTTEEACISSSGAKWVTEGSALKYAVYEGVNSELVSVGYVNKKGTIDIHRGIKLSHTPRTMYIYIWLDGELADNSYANLSFEGYIDASAEYVNNFPNAPVLDDGMIPVTIDDNGDVFTVDKNDPNWYDYYNQKWANIVLVNDTNRQTYLNNLSNNVQVNEDDILAYYVWIPRYKYRIPYKKCSDIPETDRNMDDYPECYAPYTMSDADKDKLVTYTMCPEEDNYYDDYNNEKTVALEEVNYALKTGKFVDSFSFDINNDGNYTYHYLITSIVEFYNDGINNQAGFCNYSVPDGTRLILTPSSFNGNNRLIDEGNEVSIDIEFEPADLSMSKGDAINTYYTHPAFWWDNNSNGVVNVGETIAGIWVGKFETSHSTLASVTTKNNLGCTNENCTNADGIIIKNNVPSHRQNNVSNFFYASRSMTRNNNPFGLNSSQTDSHMMKNSEWGTVAYLSHSIYGINKEIRLNNNHLYKTGCGSSSENGSTTSSCTLAYGSFSSYPQSTTGNIFGIFDMSGGTNEYVMGVMSDSNGTPRSGYSTSANSGFNGLLSDGTSYTSGVAFPESKYYDLYLQSQFNGIYINNMVLCTFETCGGDALNETLYWYGDNVSFVSPYGPWFSRGLDNINGAVSGVWSSRGQMGREYSDYSWRSVLVVRDS